MEIDKNTATMNSQTEGLVLAAFSEYHEKLIEHLRNRLSPIMIDRFFGWPEVPDDEDVVIYTILLTGMRIIGGKWGGRGVTTLRAMDIVSIEGDAVNFWVPRGPNKVTGGAWEDSLLALIFQYLTSRATGTDRLFRTTYAKVLERFYEFERELNGTETFIPKDIRRLIATAVALNVMGRNWDDVYKFDSDVILPKRWNREAVITGEEDL